jgi:hypothetical protein
MAILKARNFALITGAPVVTVPPGEWNGRMRCQVDDITLAAAQIADSIAIAKLPAGARFIDCVIRFAALGASTTLSLGIIGTVAKYLAAFATSAAGSALFANTGVIAEVNAVIAAETDLHLTLAGGAATGLVKTQTWYMLD